MSSTFGGEEGGVRRCLSLWPCGLTKNISRKCPCSCYAIIDTITRVSESKSTYGNLKYLLSAPLPIHILRLTGEVLVLQP